VFELKSRRIKALKNGRTLEAAGYPHCQPLLSPPDTLCVQVTNRPRAGQVEGSPVGLELSCTRF